MATPPLQFTLAELSARVGVQPRTIRDYQRRGLLPRPEIHGRIGIYTTDHEQRLRLIRSLKAQGLSLGSIAALLSQGADITSSVAAIRKRVAGAAHEGEILPLDPSVLQALNAVDPELMNTMERLGWIIARGPSYVAPTDVMALLRQLLGMEIPSTSVRQLLAAVHALTTIVERSSARLEPDDQNELREMVLELVARSLGLINATGR